MVAISSALTAASAMVSTLSTSYIYHTPTPSASTAPIATSIPSLAASKVASAPFAFATHRVLAGFNGLHFEPENIVAEIGDLVEVHFNPKNHSFAQSSFANPCKPIGDNAFFSGFQPTEGKESENIFTITVTDKTPIWFYCAQTVGAHCQMGMAGVINQNFNSPNTLDAYKKAAALSGVSVAPPRVQGGFISANNGLDK